MMTSQARGRTSGWAAFDLKQRQKQALGSGSEEDPFPPITGPLTSLHPCRNHGRDNDFSNKSFSSTLRPSFDFPVVAETDSNKQLGIGKANKSQHGQAFIGAKNSIRLEKLKEVHSWADDSLIEDIIGALDNNFDKASSLLEGMASTGLFGEVEGQHIAYGHSPNDAARKDAACSLVGNACPDTPTAEEPFLEGNEKYFTEDAAFSGKDAPDHAARAKLISARLKVPLEPEWDDGDDDIYAKYRRGAIRMMRSASQHSKAAQNAFLRGDHASAQQCSLKAREEWLAAEKLNAQAAKEILCVRNSENDVWKLDLHGLHATEATQALKEHLKKIETLISLNGGSKPYHKNGVTYSSALTLTRIDTQNLDRLQASRQRPLALQVITGVGNHSRGQAALPAAVRSFLYENGYHFDEIRPGVVTVRPKFRHR